MADNLAALRSSVGELAGIVRPLDDAAIAAPAHPSEWTIADVLSHLGSGAVIAERRLDSVLTGTETPPDFNEKVWSEWNAKSARAKSDDGLAADARLLSRLEAVAPEDRRRFRSTLGPIVLDWDALVGMRLNEHVVHTWDVAVAVDRSATLAREVTPFVVDRLELVATYTGKAVGPARTVTVATSDPERSIAVVIGEESVSLAEATPASEPDLSIPAEAFVRLVYGRLDPAHTPAGVKGDERLLEQLRTVFPGP
jgi:uncharacterized protein (TIGR03083 family)